MEYHRNSCYCQDAFPSPADSTSDACDAATPNRMAGCGQFSVPHGSVRCPTGCSPCTSFGCLAMLRGTCSQHSQTTSLISSGARISVSPADSSCDRGPRLDTCLTEHHEYIPAGSSVCVCCTLPSQYICQSPAGAAGGRAAEDGGTPTALPAKQKEGRASLHTAQLSAPNSNAQPGDGQRTPGHSKTAASISRQALLRETRESGLTQTRSSAPRR